MNKRLRKKREVGEFVRYGFAVAVLFKRDVEIDMFAFICAADDALSHQEPFVCGLCAPLGGSSSGATGFVTRCSRTIRSERPGAAKFLHFHRCRGSATEADRERVRMWLESHPEVRTYRIGKLADVNENEALS